jgi:hypothetical protein
VSKPAVTNFVQALAAVLAGNAVYFLLMPHLPPWAQHTGSRTDLGVMVDFVFCVAILIIIKTTLGRKQPDKT